MRILLLGAHGMLGHALAEVFASEDLITTDKETVDITGAAAVQTYVSEVKPEVIINAAAYTAVDKAEEERALAFAVNAIGVENVARAAKAAAATLVQYSTDYVFSGSEKTGYAEDDTPGPAVNAYGESKLAGEEALQRVAPKHYLLRTAWLYGTHGKNFVDTMLQLGKKTPEVRVVNDQYGSPTYTRDLAQATQQLLQSHPPGIYHAVNEGVATWYDFAKAIFERAHIDVAVHPISTSEYPLPARRPQYSVLRRTRGVALRPWREALDEYIKSK